MSAGTDEYRLSSVYTITNYSDAGISRIRVYNAEGKLHDDFWCPADLVTIFRGEIERFRRMTGP